MIGSKKTKVLSISVRIDEDEYNKIVDIIVKSKGTIKGISGLFKSTIISKIKELINQ